VHQSDPAWVRRPREDAKMGGADSTSVHPRTHARKQPQPRISTAIHTQALHMSYARPHHTQTEP
jgi:hypothetical protein